MRVHTGWSRDPRVTADSEGAEGMVGVMGLQLPADRTGFIRGISTVIDRIRRMPIPAT